MRIPFAAIGSFLILGCLSDSVSYSPEQDDEAYAAIASSWSTAAGDLQLSLCESAGPDDPENSCQVEHVVRSGGRGLEHTESHGGGCGGCPFQNVAYVTGLISGAGLPADTRVEGEVILGSGIGTDDPYGYPYQFTLSCMDPNAPCFLHGWIEEDGTVRLDSYPSTSGTSEEIALVRSGNSTCQ